MFPAHPIRAGALLAAPLTAALAGIPAAAQGPGDSKSILVPCCKCADGSVQTVDISTGAAPWRVSPPTGPSAAAILYDDPPAPWTTALSPAQWIRHPTVEDAGDYVYELRYRVQKCGIPAEVTVSGQFTADNSATLTVGSPTPVFTATGPTAYTSTFPFSKVIGTGAGAVQVAVTNNEAFTGMVLRGTIAVRCPKELLTD